MTHGMCVAYIHFYIKLYSCAVCTALSSNSKCPFTAVSAYYECSLHSRYTLSLNPRSFMFHICVTTHTMFLIKFHLLGVVCVYAPATVYYHLCAGGSYHLTMSYTFSLACAFHSAATRSQTFAPLATPTPYTQTTRTRTQMMWEHWHVTFPCDTVVYTGSRT